MEVSIPTPIDTGPGVKIFNPSISQIQHQNFDDQILKRIPDPTEPLEEDPQESEIEK